MLLPITNLIDDGTIKETLLYIKDFSLSDLSGILNIFRSKKIALIKNRTWIVPAIPPNIWFNNLFTLSKGWMTRFRTEKIITTIMH